ncbi:MAG: 30S ribosomal protein S6 [Pirellulaceae bacterium]
MSEHVFESMFILNPNSYAKNPGGVANTVEELVKNSGGKILASRLWNEQKLAYPINGHRKGVYWLTYFSLEATEMPKFNRACQLQDMILRHLAIRVDNRIADTLVSVAKGEKVLPQPELVVGKVTVNVAEEEEVEE